MWSWIPPSVGTVLLLWGAVAQAQARPSGAPCAVEPVRIARVWSRSSVEQSALQLTRCDGEPNRDALDELSILARPRSADRPDEADIRRNGRFVAPGIARLHPGLLSRLQAIADQFPGRRIEIISGYRPRARRTSRHRHGRALDIRVQAASRASVSEHARTLPETGVGYYPNSLFTHIDVREESAYWVDRSGPGQPADYGPARQPARELEDERREVLASALRALDALDADTASAPPADGDDHDDIDWEVPFDLGEVEPAGSPTDGPVAAVGAAAPTGGASADDATSREASAPDEPLLSPEEIRQLREQTLLTLRALLDEGSGAADVHVDRE